MNIEIEKNLELDVIKLQKMAFIFNAIQKGWNVSKKNDLYVFKKNHEGKKEVFLDDYLKRFMCENMNFDDILNKNN
jgi:hypothetical protein